MHSKSDTTSVIINDKANEIIEILLESLLTDIKLDWKHQLQVVILSLIVFIYYITNAIKSIINKVDHI